MIINVKEYWIFWIGDLAQSPIKKYLFNIYKINYILKYNININKSYVLKI